MRVMFLPTWRTELFSSVYAKSKGYTDLGPTCFFPIMPNNNQIKEKGSDPRVWANKDFESFFYQYVCWIC